MKLGIIFAFFVTLVLSHEIIDDFRIGGHKNQSTEEGSNRSIEEESNQSTEEVIKRQKRRVRYNYCSQYRPPRNVCAYAFEASYCNVGSWRRPITLRNRGWWRFYNRNNDMDSFIVRRGCKLRIFTSGFRRYKDFFASRNRNRYWGKLGKYYDDNIDKIVCYC